MHDKNLINQKEEQLRKQLASITVTDHGIRTAATPEYICEHMYAAVVNTDKNKDLLSHCPHESIANLSVIAKGDLGDGRNIFITNDFIQLFHLSGEEIIGHAKANMLHEGYTCRSLSQTVIELLATELSTGDMNKPLSVPSNNEEYPVYIITTSRGYDGAAVISSRAIMDEVYAKLDGDYYLLPSSRHEVLAIPASESPDPDALKEMVMSVNASEVMDYDQLSDDVYYYDGRCLKLADALSKSQMTDHSELSQAKCTHELHVMCR